MQSDESKEKAAQRQSESRGPNEAGRRSDKAELPAGNPIDDVGGAGMGQAPGEGGNPPERRATNPQDKRNQGRQ